ncbi:MAG: 23S rRNA (adenine(2503)-C(2))-methyltransferase RlmN [Verrucomicrobia bacterium]|nr:23S rRNA (adenine(2503)-C(2))-methyltransferase RlmN [Verrucomicrobiota bacterium]
MRERIDICGLTRQELEGWFLTRQQLSYRAAQVLDWLYRKRVKTAAAMTNLPAELRRDLDESYAIGALEAVRMVGSTDTTQKFLFRLRDGALVETVLIPASPALYGSKSDRRTLCVSTQVGCAYGCRFCASGLAGWTRNLRAAEIVEQVLRAEELSGEKVNNLVFMGMGEPLANFAEVMRAVSIINAPWGVGIGARHITISTSGLAPKIRELADQPLQVRLAVSLHGATDEVREQIMPVNRKYNLAVLMEACEYYVAKKKQRLTLEYILIEGLNDRPEDARALVRFASRLDAKVNLIPYNRVAGLPWNRPAEAQQHAFHRILTGAGVTATIRREKGHDIDAACGQLRLRAQT